MINEADQTRRISCHDTAGIHTSNNKGSSADNGPVPYGNRTQDHCIDTDIDSVTEHGNPFMWGPFTDRHSVAKRTSGTDNSLLMHHEPHPVLKSKPWADLRLVIELNTHQPMDKQHIKTQKR
jgi:hypothetical protein